MTSLYHLAEKNIGAYAIVEQMIDDGCSDDEINEAFNMLDDIDAEFEQKIINVAFHIRNMKAESEAIASAIKEMQTRKKAIDSKIESYTEYALNQLEKTSTTVVKSPYFAVSVRVNPVSVEIMSHAIISDDLLLPAKPREPDKKAIKAAIEGGRCVIGCSLERTKSLVIK
jgi:hypothetical protein